MNKTDPTGMQSYECAKMGTGCAPSAAQDAAFDAAYPVAVAVADFVPVIGDVKGAADFANNPTLLNGVAVAAGLIPAAGDLASAALRNSDVVVRGGTSTASQFANGSGVISRADGTISNVSVSSAPGATAAELGSTVRNNRMGVTTVGDIRAAGGQIVRDPSATNPAHCLMCGLTPEQAENLFNPTVPNPNPRKW